MTQTLGFKVSNMKLKEKCVFLYKVILDFQLNIHILLSPIFPLFFFIKERQYFFNLDL